MTPWWKCWRLLVIVLTFILSLGSNLHYECTTIIRHSWGNLVKYCVSEGCRKNVLWILTTALRRSCKFTPLLHSHLAAALQMCAFLFLCSSCAVKQYNQKVAQLIWKLNKEIPEVRLMKFCRILDQFKDDLINILDQIMSLFELRHFSIGTPCKKNISRTPSVITLVKFCRLLGIIMCRWHFNFSWHCLHIIPNYVLFAYSQSL